MTSKEALEHIIFDAKMEKPIFSMYYQEFLKPIEKDLEVLDILKKWIVVDETYDDLFPYEIKLRNGYVSNKSCLTFTKDDYEKVKEWLKNE